MMKNILYAFSLGFLVLLLSGCLKDSCTEYITYEKRTPILADNVEYRISPTLEAPREFEKTGKIYYYNDYILLNEVRKGIHLINNINPSNPVVEAFINIPGNMDMAVKNGVLFADSYNDLVSARLGDLKNLQFLNRVEAVFPTYGVNENGIEILGYDVETVTEKVDCGMNSTARGIDYISFDNALSSQESFSKGGTGLGGSLARFSIADDHLYIVDDSNLKVFDIGNGSRLEPVSDFGVGWGIETLFAHDDKLFIGGNIGMSIYDISTNPASPSYLGGYEHIFSCDPVFVKDNFAYVTLRNGNTCQGVINQLDLVDISNPEQVRLVTSFSMLNPHGLSISDNNLFLSEGDHGLKVFDISNPINLDQHLRSFLTSVNTRDIITLPRDEKIILVVGPDGIHQYNFDNPNDLKLISFLGLPSF